MAAKHGKVVAVSGAASGIGLATAKHLYKLGVRLSLTDINKDGLNAAVAAIQQEAPADMLQPADILTTVTDVRFSRQVDEWIERTVGEMGALDGAANLAGVLSKGGQVRPLVEMSDEEWGFVTHVNLDGVFYALRAQLRAMEKLGAKPGRSIVNAASTAGLQGARGIANYSASKHGVVGLTRSAAKEVGKSDIRVNAIAPGPIHTPMTHSMQGMPQEAIEAVIKLRQALGRFGQPEEVSKVIAFLLSEDSSFVNGAVVAIDGGELC
ncbi:3-oxoacyl-reductase [Thozetella sp. PMI_491]|nr:3-oxoacyl-reductase [Thozetella sp. PMI_491]